MIIFDPMYGEFDVPEKIVGLIQTPEFRRLSQVRLLNTLSPTLATLGELRRYSHTLGVLYLEGRWEQSSDHDFTRDELDAFQAAIILHDIGTPPFGHLFEYILRETTGWHHEDVIVAILRGQHAPENTAHQFFAGRTLKVARALQRSKIDVDIVSDILTNSHPLSALILGKLDFDNIDNVSRMSWALGVKGIESMAVDMATNINVTRSGKVVFPMRCRGVIEKWMALRRQAYNVIVFDAMTVSAQVVLTKAIKTAINDGIISLEDWSLTDEQLLSILQEHHSTKDYINQQYLGVLPEHVLTAQIDSTSFFVNKETKDRFIGCYEEYAKSCGLHKPLCYVFLDKGTFEKEFLFCDENVDSEWSVGKKSDSAVIYLFNQSHEAVSGRTKIKLNEYVRDYMCINDGNIKSIVLDGDNGQRTLDF